MTVYDPFKLLNTNILLHLVFLTKIYILVGRVCVIHIVNRITTSSFLFIDQFVYDAVVSK